MARNTAAEPTAEETYSPYIIPERIVCPQCGQIDQFDFTLGTNLRVTLALLLWRLVPILAPRLIRPLAFGLSDGTLVHPLEAIERYQQQVAHRPQDVKLRLKYANLLNNLGYHSEAETHFQHVLEQSPDALGAMIGLANIHAVRQEPDQVRHYLELVAKRAPKSNHPRREEFMADVQPYLTGELPLDTFQTDFSLVEPTTPPASSATPPRSNTGRKQKRKKRKRRKK
jgi:tetratricopeptide (TPR) repeat protein